MVCTRNRARQPRASRVWQVLHDHADKLPALHPETAAAIAAFLECGDLHAGFTRLLCPDCGHEFLLAFTCKQRGLCASCHQGRTLIGAAFIADELCAAVPHRHVVLTVPRLIRTVFPANRVLLDAGEASPRRRRCRRPPSSRRLPPARPVLPRKNHLPRRHRQRPL
ncbi:MAG: transposase zinc-binding domain-containing protein, partial [Verrucomicrobia bacterium]|nr:transposase zinc-binding domain-containing protein [Verrucomicrobiota bacterium]